MCTLYSIPGSPGSAARAVALRGGGAHRVTSPTTDSAPVGWSRARHGGGKLSGCAAKALSVSGDAMWSQQPRVPFWQPQPAVVIVPTPAESADSEMGVPSAAQYVVVKSAKHALECGPGHGHGLHFAATSWWYAAWRHAAHVLPPPSVQFAVRSAAAQLACLAAGGRGGPVCGTSSHCAHSCSTLSQDERGPMLACLL